MQDHSEDEYVVIRRKLEKRVGECFPTFQKIAWAGQTSGGLLLFSFEDPM